MSDRVTQARSAILEDLKRRYKEVPGHGGVGAAHDTSRFCKPQANYYFGTGEILCPICKKGTLVYSRASRNGHVMARCSTDGCVAWME